MNCLNCGTEMMNYDVTTKQGEISYDTCEKCGSLWLDAGELDKMAFQVEGSIEYCSEEKSGKPDSKPKMCPRCDGSALDAVMFLSYPDVILHRCRNCGGFWLDGGQLNVVDKKLKEIMPVQGKGFSDFVNHVHIPYFSKVVRKRSSQTDFHLDVPPIKGAVEEGSTKDNCPDCAVPLARYRAFSIEFEGCPKCKGTWLYKHELLKLKDQVRHGSLRWMNDEVENVGMASARPSNRNCVKCKTTKMLAVLFGKSAVMVDWCPQCHGIWLEKREFDSIVDYLKNEADEMKPGGIRKEALDEVKRLWEGGSVDRLEELRDAHAAMWALVNASLINHPTLFALLESVRM